MKEKFKEIAEQAGMGYVGLSDTEAGILVITDPFIEE